MDRARAERSRQLIHDELEVGRRSNAEPSEEPRTRPSRAEVEAEDVVVLVVRRQVGVREKHWGARAARLREGKGDAVGTGPASDAVERYTPYGEETPANIQSGARAIVKDR